MLLAAENILIIISNILSNSKILLAIPLLCPKSPKFLLSYYFLCFVLVDLCTLLNVNKCPVHFRVYIQSGVCIRKLEVLVLLKITVFGKVTRKQYLDDSGSTKAGNFFDAFGFVVLFW